MARVLREVSKCSALARRDCSCYPYLHAHHIHSPRPSASKFSRAQKTRTTDGLTHRGPRFCALIHAAREIPRRPRAGRVPSSGRPPPRRRLLGPRHARAHTHQRRRRARSHRHRGLELGEFPLLVGHRLLLGRRRLRPPQQGARRSVARAGSGHAHEGHRGGHGHGRVGGGTGDREGVGWWWGTARGQGHLRHGRRREGGHVHAERGELGLLAALCAGCRRPRDRHVCELRRQVLRAEAHEG